MIRTHFLRAFVIGIGALLPGAPAVAMAAPAEVPETLMGSEIQALVAGNTVTGSTASRGTFLDFYAPDGTLKGRGYAGSWSIENNALCLKLGRDGSKQCWQLGLKGDQIEWLRNGKVTGTGAVIAGNPNKL